MARPSITEHAITRYQERVDPRASRLEARLALARLVTDGHIRSTPRHWMRGDVDVSPGLRFLYCAHCPDVCVLIRGGAMITVLTRELCRSSSNSRLTNLPDRQGRSRTHVRPWRWDGDMGEAA
jgi:hypothetical protein